MSADSAPASTPVRAAGLPAGVVAFTTTRAMRGASPPPYDRFNLGASCGDDDGIVASNRETLARALELPSLPFWLRQVHSAEVVDADAPPGAQPPVADAATTRTRGRVLAVLTADCLPVVLACDDGSALAVAHAGWRGLRDGVLEAAVGALRVPGARVSAWLGPAIGPASYEVGADVRDAFVSGDAALEAAFVPARSGHWWCDLYRIARHRLARAGVVTVAGGGFDTLADPARFYSFRRDGATGRMATLAWLAP